MIQRVLLVAWKGSAATAWVEHLRAGGFTVLLEDTTGERAWRTAKERGIDLVVIDGQKKPSHGRQTGHALRDTAKTRNIPIIWTNLDGEDEAGVHAEVKPDRIVRAPTDAAQTLEAIRSLQSERGVAPAALPVALPGPVATGTHTVVPPPPVVASVAAVVTATPNVTLLETSTTFIPIPAEDEAPVAAARSATKSAKVQRAAKSTKKPVVVKAAPKKSLVKPGKKPVAKKPAPVKVAKKPAAKKPAKAAAKSARR